MGLAVLATSHSPTTYYLGWVVLGVAMSAGLYDAAFSTLGQLLGANAKRSHAQLPLAARLEHVAKIDNAGILVPQWFRGATTWHFGTRPGFFHH